MEQFKWKNRFLSSDYNLYQGEEHVGQLSGNWLRNRSAGHLGEANYTFQTRGFWKPKTIVSDAGGNVLGEIRYNNWMTKAVLKLNDKEVTWKYKNIWNTKWEIRTSVGEEVFAKNHTFSGNVTTNSEDSLLILMGLYVMNYYQQIMMVIIIGAAISTIH